MNGVSEKPLARGMAAGALVGVSAWLMYGVVELILGVAVPILTSNESELLAWQWPLIGMLLAVYAVAGLLCGAAGGAWMARRGRIPGGEDHKTLACAILALAFALNLSAGWPLARSENLALALAMALAAGFFAALRSAVWQRRTAFLAAPFLLSTVLLIGPWVSRGILADYSSWVKAGGSLLAVAVVVAIAAVWHKTASARPAPRILAAGAGAVVLLGMWAGLRSPAVAETAAAASGRPNILLITMDTVRADHVSAYGYKRDTTPRLREFARQSTLYGNAIACSDFTLPTHASMFTGLYPSWHRAIVEPEHPYGGSLRPGAKTMAGMLRASGYWTAEAVANYGYLGETSGLTQGFERVDARVAVHLADTNRPFYLREGARRLLNSFLDTDRFDEYRLRASDINRHAFDILDRAESRRQPFFLFLNYMDAHVPYIPGEPFGERFSEEEAHVKPIPAREYLPVRDAVNAGKRVLADAEKRYLISQYDAGIANIDAAIGDLLARLRERGLYDNTLIIVTSDHGEAFGDHDYMEHAVGSLYQDQVHVPLFVKYPGRHEASQSDALVSQVDFLPTVLETAGIAVPSGLQGESFRSRGRDAVIFAETSTRGSLRSMPRFRGMRRAIFSGGLKLILWTDGAPEFYEVAGDEAELKNEFRPDDPRIAQLTARAITWIAAMPRPAAGSRNPKPVDPATLQRLRSLGYAK